MHKSTNTPTLNTHSANATRLHKCGACGRTYTKKPGSMMCPFCK